MAFAVEPAPAGGELTAVRALGRLRRAAPAAVNTAMAAIALVAAGIAVAFSGGTDMEPHELLALVGLGLAIAVCAALGALILAGRPRHGLGLALLIGGATASVWLFMTAWSEVPAGSDRPLVQWAAWLDNWIFVGLIVLVTWPLLLFPDGSLPSRRWRPVGALVLVSTAAVAIGGMLDPGTLTNFDDVQNPLGIPESWTWVNVLGGFGFGIPLGVVAGMLAVQRQARARPAQGMRAALWASRALAANFVLVVLAIDPESPVYAATLTASTALFAAAATVAVLRDRVIEVDIVLRRAFVVAGVAAAGLVVFVAVFAAVSALAGSSAGALAGGLAVALVAVPLRTRVSERVNRSLYGHRDPSTAVARFSEQLELADEPADALPGVARALRETLGASSVLIEPAAALALAPAHSGAEAYEPVIERAIRHRGTLLGRLVIGARAPGEGYAPVDLALTEVLVRQVALVLDALRMATALQQSREAIVNAREEERRRLRHELHDGLGSALTGIALTLQAARNTGGPQGDELVEGAREQTHAAVADVRRLVRGLRPPVLEDLGLAAALRAHADRLGPLEVEFELPEAPLTLSAAVELALYRIATEALTNVVRHAHARHCLVRLHGDGDEVALAVVDDGHGLAPDAAPGVGLRSMRERAAELGGRVEFTTGPGGGLAGDGAAGVSAALELQPDVVLMDLAMPGMTGIEATTRLTAAAPHIGIVVMTMLEDDDAVVQALRSGARGYIVKGAQQHEILDAIRSVHAGRAVIGATVARQLASLVTGPAPTDPFPDLTTRERDVLAALTAGASTAQIAGRLGLSDKTVRNHISNILTKLEVVDRTQAVLKAREAGLRS